MPFRAAPGLAALEDAMAARNIAEHRAYEVRRRLGYLISPEQRRALDDLEAALTRVATYQTQARAELAREYEQNR